MLYQIFISAKKLPSDISKPDLKTKSSNNRHPTRSSEILFPLKQDHKNNQLSTMPRIILGNIAIFVHTSKN